MCIKHRDKAQFEIIINKGKVEYVKGHTQVKIDMKVE